MIKNAKVSIGLPVFNGEDWLNATLVSILEQSYADFELVISDNASTDNTQEICDSFRVADDRVRYYRNAENVGVYRNYDQAFLRTSSDYFKWWAVGDLCDPSFLSKAVAILDVSQDVVLVHSCARLVGDLPANSERYLATLNLIDDSPVDRFKNYLTTVRLNNVMNGLIRSRQLSQTCLNRVFHGSDKCMIAELALRGKFIEIPEELFIRRMQSATATSWKNAEEARKFFADEPESPASLSNWKAEFTLIRGIFRSPVEIIQKVTLLTYILKRIFWTRRKLIDEFGVYLRSLVSST